MNKRKMAPYLVFNTEGGDTGGGSTTETPPAGTTPQGNEPAKPAEGETPDQVIARLQAEVAKANKEAESARVNAKAKIANDAKKDQLLALAKAIGIEIPGAEEETVESLTKKLTDANGKVTQTEEQTKALAQGRAIDRAAWANQVPIGHAGYLEYTLANNKDFQALDSTAADYQTKVTELVKGIVAADPIFKVTPGGTTRSGQEAPAGAGGPEVVTQEAFDKMDIQEQTKLYQTNPSLFARLSGAA